MGPFTDTLQVHFTVKHTENAPGTIFCDLVAPIAKSVGVEEGRQSTDVQNIDVTYRHSFSVSSEYRSLNKLASRGM